MVEWINGTTEQTKHTEFVGGIQGRLKHMWEEGWDLGVGRENWDQHIFREHNKVAEKRSSGQRTKHSGGHAVDVWVLGRKLRAVGLWVAVTVVR